MNTFLKTNHQLKRWLPSLKVLAIATSMTVGLAVSESVSASAPCFPDGAGYYCFGNSVTYSTQAACHVACGLPPPPASQYTLTLNTTGTGTVNGGGSFPEGTKVDLVATPAADSTFAGWSSGCSSGMTLMANTTCTATFNKGDSTTPTTTPTTSSTPPLPENMSVFIQVDGNGSGSVSTGAGLSCKREDCQPNSAGELICQENCRQVVKTASNVTLTPKADANSVFSSWGGNQDCVDGQLANITSSTLCTAYFHRLYKLTVAVDGPGIVTGKTLGYDSKTPINCGQGQTQCNNTYESIIKDTLQAQPLDKALFLGWDGDCQSSFSDFVLSTDSVSLDSDKDMTCEALFVEPITSQAENDQYNPATPVTANLTVNNPAKLDQTITKFSPATSAVVGDQVTLTATRGASDNPITYTSTTPTVCTVSGDTVSLLAVETCTIKANQDGNDQYNAASTVTANIQVNAPAVKKDQVITNFAPTNYVLVEKAMVGGKTTLAATGGASGNPVTYTSTTPTICTVSENTVNLVAVGACIITADQAGNDQYNPASPVVAKIEVTPPTQSDQTTPETEPSKFPGCTALVIEEPISVFNVSLCVKAPGQSEPFTYVREYEKPEDMQELATEMTNMEEFGDIKPLVNNDGSTDPTSGGNLRVNVSGNSFDLSFSSKDDKASIIVTVNGKTFNINALNLKNGNPELEYFDLKGTVGTFQGPNAEESITLLTEYLTQTAKQPKWVSDLIGSLLRGVLSLVAKPKQTPTDSTVVNTTPVAPVVSETSSTPRPSQACPNITEENGVLIVSGACNANGEVFDKPVRILPGASISNVTFNNTVDNQGLLSNLTIGEKGEVKGGMLSGSVKNQGKVCDIEFMGSSFVGGTVCGKINNASKVGACLILENVIVLPDTTFKGCVKKKDQVIMVDMVEDTGSVTTGNTSSTTSPTPVKKEQTISFDEALPTTAEVGSQQLIQVTTSSGLVVDLVNDTPQVCKLFGSAVTFLTTGTCTVTANQAGNDGYNAATVSANITVERADQTIILLPPPSGKVGDEVSLSAFGGNSGNPVTFASDTPKICTVSENTLKFIAAAGICMVTANQAGNDNYNAAKPVSVSTIGVVSAGITKENVFTLSKGHALETVCTSNCTPTFSLPLIVDISSHSYIKFGANARIPSSETIKKSLVQDNITLNDNVPSLEKNLAFLNTLCNSLICNPGDFTFDTNGSLSIATGTSGLWTHISKTTVYKGIKGPGLYLPGEETQGTKKGTRSLEEGFPYLVFVDTDGQLKQTYFYPMLSPVIEKALSEEMPTTTVESALDGTIKLTFESGVFVYWKAGYVVTFGSETALEVNWVGDNLVLSAGGQSQEFTPGTPTFDESSIEFLKVLLKGAEELGFDPNNLMMTGFGSFVIVDANDNVIVSFKAGIPEVDTGTQTAGLYVSEGETPYVLFVDVDNQLKRSLIHPALSPDILVAALEAFPQSEFTLSPDGKVTVSFDGEPATEWQPAYLVTAGGETFEKQLVEGQLILSGGGQSQILLPVQP